MDFKGVPPSVATPGAQKEGQRHPDGPGGYFSSICCGFGDARGTPLSQLLGQVRHFFRRLFPSIFETNCYVLFGAEGVEKLWIPGAADVAEVWQVVVKIDAKPSRECHLASFPTCPQLLEI